MKRIICLFFVIAMIFTLCACGGETEEEKSVLDKVADASDWYISFHISMSYGDAVIGAPTFTHYVADFGDNNYLVTGKVTVRDRYGDECWAKYEASVRYNPDTDKCSVTDYEVGTFYVK